MLAALLGVGCAIDAFVEPYRPVVTHATVRLQKLAPGTRLRIVHISDVHSERRARLEARLPELISAEHPDLIVFTGDAVNESEGLPVFRKMMGGLTHVAPVFAVRGNWDNSGIYAGTGVRELRGDTAELSVRGQKVAVAGEGFYGFGLRKELSALPPDVVSLALIHTPDAVFDAPHASLVLAGHTHGGQVRMPWYGALVTLSKYGKRLESGLYRVDDSWLYVNRGIGMEKGAPVRFLCRPEVTVLDLVGSSQS